MKRTLMMIMCVIMAISLFGCGQSKEEKYMSLRNEVETEMKACNDVKRAYKTVCNTSFYRLFDINEQEFKEKYLPQHKKALSEFIAIQKRVMPKLEEMEKLAKDNLKLKKDFEEFGVENAMHLKELINYQTNVINNPKDYIRNKPRFDPKEALSNFKD